MGWQDRDYNREEQGSSMRFALPRITSLALVLISVCTAVYVIQHVTPFGGRLFTYGAFTFDGGLWYSQPWRWVTYQYLHADFGHLIWNMLSIYFIVPILERHWGWRKTLVLYTCAGIAGAAALAVLSPWVGWASFLVGASGCILGVLGTVAYIAPKMNMMFMMIAPMSMRVVAIIYAVIYSLVVLTDKNQSDAAHLGGLIFGVAAPWLLSQASVVSRQRDRWAQRNRHRAIQEEIDEQKEVDRILAKVAEQGMNSLSSREKKALARATENQRKRDLEREKRIRASW